MRTLFTRKTLAKLLGVNRRNKLVERATPFAVLVLGDQTVPLFEIQQTKQQN